MSLNSLTFFIAIVCSSHLFAQEQTGTLQGQIGIYEGNCIPSPGVAPCEPVPLSTTVILTTPSASYEVSLLVDSVVCDSKGYFEITLPVGKYSMFLRDGSAVVCKPKKCNPVCICRPVDIKSDSLTVMNANIDHASW